MACTVRRRTTRKRATTRRRSNPIRTTGMLVVNPRRNKRRVKRRSAASSPRRRTNGGRRTKASRRSAALKGLRRRRNVSRRRGKSLGARSFYKRNGGVRRRSRSKRRTVRRRRNSGVKGMLGGVYSTVTQMTKKVPFIGALLAPAGLGALSTELNMWLAATFGPMLPFGLSSAWIYAGAGVFGGAIVQKFGGGILGAKFANDLGIALASAGAAVGYYKVRTSTDIDAATEVGMLEYSGIGLGALTVGNSYGDGMGYLVEPYPGAAGYGALAVVGQ